MAMCLRHGVRMNYGELQQYVVKKYFKYQEMDIWKWTREFKCVRDKIVVHIPARAGSSRIKDKNIASLGGYPLLAYAVALAKSLKADRIIVNTDSKKYARIAERFGAEVPFLRPEELSSSTISPGIASYYALRHLIDEEYPVNIMIDLYPTMPFRNHNTIATYLETTKKSGHCYTAIPLMHDFDRLYYGGKQLSKMMDQDAQNMFPFRVLASFMGALVCFSDIRWFEYELLNNPIEMIDIDTAEDLKLAETVVQKGLYNFDYTIA
jgi:CMP-N-acetylneuraminic acid synthetase